MIKNILIVVIGLALIGAVFVFVKPMLSGSEGPVACTQEAKQCPDGSYVGRTGPKCEFTACPDVVTQKVVFQCAGGKSITATFKPQAVEFYVSDGRSVTFNLKQTATGSDNETEVRYASDDNKTVLWVNESSAFLEENGKTTFSACIATPAEFPEINSASELPLPN